MIRGLPCLVFAAGLLVPSAACAACAACRDDETRASIEESIEASIEDPATRAQVRRLLFAEDADERRDAADELGDRGGRSAAALPALARAVGDTSAEVRREVYDSLRDIAIESGPEARSEALRVLGDVAGKDPDAGARTTAVDAIEELGFDVPVPLAVESLRVLGGLLDDDDLHTRREAVRAVGLVARRNRSRLEARRAFLRTRPSENTVREVDRSIAHLDRATTALVEPLRAAAESSEHELREDAVEALGRIADGVPKAREVIARALEDAHREVREEAIEALARMGARWDASEAIVAEVVRALTSALGNADGETREEAAEALAGLGAKGGAAIPALCEALSHPSEQTREEVVEALGRIGRSLERGHEELIDGLVGALRDPQRDVRRSAAEALGLLGAPAAAAVEALERRALDTDKEVRSAARRALYRIERATRSGESGR